MEITITGGANALVAPELGRLHLNVSFSGRDMSKVLRDTQSRANALIAELEALPSETLDDFVVGSVTSYSNRPPNTRGRGQTTHHANCRITAVFKDFSALSQASSEWAELEGVNVGHTTWRLTDATRDATLASLLGEALDAARTKAQLIADHLGHARIEVVKVSDHSPEPRAEAVFAAPAMLRASAAADAPPVEARPEDIRLETSLTVLFVTS